jgi:tRNA-2-methylthio-N6-dimethylallyladenosine synthase
MSKHIKLPVDSDFLLENQHFAQEIRKLNEEFLGETGRNRYFHVITYGCQMNEHDSEKMIAMLCNMGYQSVDSPEESDLVIFNTCAVRENAELKLFGNLGHIKTLKKNKPDMIVAVSGCMMQLPSDVEAIKDKFRFVDLVFGTHNVHELPRLIKTVLEERRQIIEVWDSEGKIIEGLPYERKIGMKAFVNIMFGCNNFCTYCIVPYTRGRERSREPEHIVEEIKLLAADGVKEVTLLGQNVNSYGKTLTEKFDFADLLEEVSKIDGIERYRFMTSHPKDISDKLIDVIINNPKVCEYVHLPIQSGSNQVLKRMNRVYTRENYLEIIRKLKERLPEIGLSTDIIIGFPGETEEDVDQTIDILEQVNYDSAFTYLYSKREGTPAALYEDLVTDNEKHERFERMLARLHEKVIAKNQTKNGKVYEVLVEGVSRNDEASLQGRTRENYLVIMKGDSSLIGKLVNVKIIRAKKFSLVGEIINTPV